RRGEIEDANAGVEIYCFAETTRGVDVPNIVHRDAIALVEIRAAHGLRPHEVAVTVQLLYENIDFARGGEVEDAEARIEIYRITEIPRGANVSRAVHRDAKGYVFEGATHGPRPHQ